MYSLQILSAICDSRPERLQECVLSAPLGVSRLVAALDDGRDAVRNAGLLLLVDLTGGANEDLRKIVAFEDVFAKVFALIRMEGGLADAGITAQDCLSLLANLVRGSASNQTMFRESGCVAQLCQLLQQVFPSADREAAFLAQSREKSAFGLLQLLRLFLVPGEPSTAQNQTAFFRAGTAQILIDIGFSFELSPPIRIAALKSAAELIANNPALQENFAALTVVALPDPDTASVASSQNHVNGTSRSHSNKGSARTSAEQPRMYIIEALLELMLDRPQHDATLRSAACGLIQAYLADHDRIKSHFLQRAISGHSQNEEAANILTSLSQPHGDAIALMLASSILQDLVSENVEAKTALLSVREGEESEGEDVLSFTQTLASELEGSLQQDGDERIVAAYASLLIVLLWEFAQGVDDVLAEGSSLVQVLAAAPKAQNPDPLLSGLAVTLLGTIYEFSTKDSSIPRRTLAPLVTQKLGRGKYLESLAALRRQPAVRDFDILDEVDGESFLSKVFVDLFTVEYSRLRRAIDKDPGVEVLPSSAVEAGVDRDVLDDIRQQLQTTKDSLSQIQEEAMAAEQRHEQDKLSAAKELQTANAEVQRLRRINQAMQQGHESELEDLAADHERQKEAIIGEHQRALAVAQGETEQEIQAAVREKDAAYTELGNSMRSEQSGHANTRQQLEALTMKHNDLVAKEMSSSEQFAELNQRYSRMEKEHEQLQASASQSSTELEKVRRDAESRLAELDALNTRLNDLKDELKAKDEELVAERAGFADLESELEAANNAAKATSSSTEDTKSPTDDASGLETELQEARQNEKAAKEELESMLLVMGDIETKRDIYRKKVKELGGEVSEDDDEDEDGDEDEDEDDEEADDEDEVD